MPSCCPSSSCHAGCQCISWSRTRPKQLLGTSHEEFQLAPACDTSNALRETHRLPSCGQPQDSFLDHHKLEQSHHVRTEVKLAYPSPCLDLTNAYHNSTPKKVLSKQKQLAAQVPGQQHHRMKCLATCTACTRCSGRCNGMCHASVHRTQKNQWTLQPRSKIQTTNLGVWIQARKYANG